MGLFDRFTSRKPQQPAPHASPPASGSAPGPVQPQAAAPSEKAATGGGVLPKLAEARRLLEARDLAGAMTVYEQVLAVSGDRADVLVAISGDLGVHGHVSQIIELVAPRYDAERHGPATGLNLLQAYLVARQPEAAQHLLDILFGLRRPDLEERLLGFSNALADLMASQSLATDVPGGSTKVNIVTISKPVWAYGLEQLAPDLLPRQEGQVRRVAFTQLAVPGLQKTDELQARPEDELGRLTRGLPLWFAEMFFHSTGYEPVAAVGAMETGHYVLLPTDWTAENVRQLAETSENGLDFVVTGAIRNRNADYELVMRIWEVRKFRELKSFSARWTPATADAALRQFQEQLRAYMEWRPFAATNPARAYAPPAAPLPHALALGASLTLFLGEKGVLAPPQVTADAKPFLAAAQANPEDLRSQLMLVTALLRLKARGVTLDEAAVEHARGWLGSEAARTADVAGIPL